MKNEDNMPPLVVLILLFLAAFCAYMAGSGSAASDFRNEAVKHGAAEYYLDANNEKQFRWNGEGK